MVSKIFWAIGIGIPSLFMLYFSLVGFNLINDDDWLQIGYIPSTEFSIAFFGAFLVTLYGAYYHLSMRAMSHKRHCELTSAVEFVAVVAFFFVLFLALINRLDILVGGTYTDWFTFTLVIAITALIGIILYRLEMKKSIIPGW